MLLKGRQGYKPYRKNMKRKITLVVLLAALAAVPFTFTTGCIAQQRENTGHVDDNTINTKVKTALDEDTVVRGAQVNVNTFQGVVQLSGFMQNEGQKEWAGHVAEQVKGVRAVHNDIVVQTGR